MSKKQAGRRVRKTRRKWQEGLRVNWDELASDLGARQRVRRFAGRTADADSPRLIVDHGIATLDDAAASRAYPLT